MANSTITIVGNIARDPELRFTASGKAVIEVGIAVNDRKKVGDNWEDDVSFIDVTAWDDLAEHISDSCDKGTRVIVQGRIKQDSWEKDGEKRSKIKLVAESFGVELRFACAEVRKTERTTDTAGSSKATTYDDSEV